MMQNFHFVCPICGMLGHGKTLKKDMPPIKFKMHLSTGRGGLQLIDVLPWNPEWLKLIAARVCQVVAILVASGFLSEEEVMQAVNEGKTQALRKDLRLLTWLFRKES